MYKRQVWAVSFSPAVVVLLASLLSADVSFSCVDSAAVVSAVVVSDGWLEQMCIRDRVMCVAGSGFLNKVQTG